ncbi:MAG: RNA polymerase sigma factor [Anaerolineae bacterium]|nr:RNA polymerase sigma factor [Anaerolineae bacterium]
MLSFEELYISYSPEVYRFATWLSGNSNDAEDITAETFARAWMNLGTIRTETLKAYLFTIARNIYLESLRKHKTHEVLNEAHPDSLPTLERSFETRNEIEQIRATVLTLPEIDRSAFVMRVQYDLSYAEIARVLRISEGTAKVKVHRVRKLLFAMHPKRSHNE